MALGEITHGGFKVQEREEPQLQSSHESSEDPRETQLSTQLRAAPAFSLPEPRGRSARASVLPQIPQRLLERGSQRHQQFITCNHRGLYPWGLHGVKKLWDKWIHF